MIGVLFEERLFDVYRMTDTGERDRYGKPILTRALVATHDGRLTQTKSEEGEAFLVNTYRASMPYGADIRAGDEVEAQGSKFTVSGAPLSSRLPGHPSVSHVTATLTFVGPVST